MKFNQIKTNQINEGVKFGQSEKNMVLSYGDKFNIGIEYEFHVPGGASTSLSDTDISDVETVNIENLSIRDIEEHINTDEGVASPIDTVSDTLFISKVFNGEEQGLCLLNPPLDEEQPRTGVIFTKNQGKVYTYSNWQTKPVNVSNLEEYINQYTDPDYQVIKHFFKALSKYQSQFKNADDEYVEDAEFSQDQSVKIIKDFMTTLSNYANKDNVDIASDVSLEFDNIFFNETSPYVYDFMPDFFNIMDDYIRTYSMFEINYKDTRPERFEQEVEEIAEDFIYALYSFSFNFETNIENIPFTQHISNTIEENFDSLYENNTIDHLIISIDYSESIDKDFFSNLESNDDLIQSVVSESQGDQIEIITKKINLENALNHIKKTFSMINSKESLYTTDESGLHISISMKDDPQNVNLVKFLMLHKMDYVIDLFPERKNVDSIMSDVMDHIGSSRKLPEFVNYILNNKSQQFIKDIDEKLTKNIIFDNKSVSINFKEFKYMDGRIELRYFGGRNYENRYDDIKHLLLRSLYFLTISTTDVYHKEYMKSLYQVLDQSFQTQVGLSVSDIIYATKYFRDTDQEKINALDSMMKKLKLNSDRYLEIIYDTIYGKK
ncbi:hypothetical protein PBI_SCTP2_125 [Salicola phage SCTP-2]|nr:hypothetical protein PBI_SCTP2_125 [Salicola phage SCTP-2]